MEELKNLTLFICGITFCIMLDFFFRFNSKIAKKGQIFSIRIMIIGLSAQAFFDALSYGHPFLFEDGEAYNIVFNALLYIPITIAAVGYLTYIEETVGFKYKNNPIYWGIKLIPLIVLFILLFTSVHKEIYYYDGERFEYGKLNFITIIINYLYFISTFLICIIYGLREKNIAKRSNYIHLCTVILFLIIAAIFEGIMPNSPIMELCIIPAVFYIYANASNSRIYTDALTGLYNRARIDEYLYENLSKCTEDHELYLFIYLLWT